MKQIMGAWLSQLAGVIGPRRMPTYAEMMDSLHGVTVGETACPNCGAIVPQLPPESRLVVDRCLSCRRPHPTRCIGWQDPDGETTHPCEDRTLLGPVLSGGHWYAQSQCGACIVGERRECAEDWIAHKAGADVAEAAAAPVDHDHQMDARAALEETLVRDRRGRPALRAVAITGGVGSGKTTVVAAHVYELIVAGGTRVEWQRAGKLLTALKSLYRDGDTGLDAKAMLARAKEAPVLVVDELGSWGWAGWTEHARLLLSELLCDRFDDGRLVTVVMGNEDIEWPDSRSASRFGGCGRPVRCDGKDLRISGGTDA